MSSARRVWCLFPAQGWVRRITQVSDSATKGVPSQSSSSYAMEFGHTYRIVDIIASSTILSAAGES